MTKYYFTRLRIVTLKGVLTVHAEIPRLSVNITVNTLAMRFAYLDSRGNAIYCFQIINN